MTQKQNHSEAPASITMKISYRGYDDILFSLRGDSGRDLLAKLDPAIDQLEEMGATPAARNRRARPATQAPPPPRNGSSSQPPPAPAAVANGNGDGSSGQAAAPGRDTFECESLVCTVENGKSYWKISDAGGRWKYPVIIYPEILGRYFDPKDLDPGQAYNLVGWEAIFEQNDRGHPKKIISLTRPGEEAPQQQPVAQPQPAAQQQQPPQVQQVQPPQPVAVEDEIPF